MRSSIGRILDSLSPHALRSSFSVGCLSCAFARVHRQEMSPGTGKRHGGAIRGPSKLDRPTRLGFRFLGVSSTQDRRRSPVYLDKWLEWFGP